MEINYTVHSCSEDEFSVAATVAGREVVAKVPGLIVELTSEDGSMSHTFRFTPDDMAAAKNDYAVGNVVVATFTPGSNK